MSDLEELLFGVYSHLVSIGFASPDEIKKRIAIATLERYKQAIIKRKNGNYLQRSLRAETTNKVRAKRRKLEHRGGSLKERRPRTYIYAPCSATRGKDTIHLPYPTSVKKIGVAKPSMCRLQCTELTKLARMKSHCDTTHNRPAKVHFELPILAVVPAEIICNFTTTGWFA